MTSETHNEAIDYRAELEDLFASPFVHLKPVYRICSPSL